MDENNIGDGCIDLSGAIKLPESYALEINMLRETEAYKKLSRREQNRAESAIWNRFYLTLPDCNPDNVSALQAFRKSEEYKMLSIQERWDAERIIWNRNAQAPSRYQSDNLIK